MILIPAHAKVNLCLAVRGRRADGFHDIDSVALTIDWHDLVGIRLRPAPSTSVRLRVTGVDGSAPPGDDNLVALAARAVAAVVGPLAADLWLDKSIPAAAGLGGGSSDAAGVLRGCASLLGAGSLGRGRDMLDRLTLFALAASLGSDVPMLVAGGAQRMRGRGELLTPVEAPALHLVVAVVGASSTAATYAAVESFDLEDGSRTDAVCAALEAGRTPAADLLGSGLEEAACRANPALGERLLALRAGLPEARWHLTGSGGAAFAVVDGAPGAAELAATAVTAGYPARACRAMPDPLG
ncbi:MAG: 4-(cytidine 5'-diphospho)-2-C-methyl-D-erythritol kinase [Candidatus Dormibacteria bacterium]